MLSLVFKTLVLVTGFITSHSGGLGESSLSSSSLTCKILRWSSMGCLIKNRGEQGGLISFVPSTWLMFSENVS